MDTLAEAYDDSAVVVLKSHVVLRGLLSPEASIHTTITCLGQNLATCQGQPGRHTCKSTGYIVFCQSV